MTYFIAKLNELDEAIERVRELHSKDYDNTCVTCIGSYDYDEQLPIYEEYPCPTIRALNGEQE